MNPNLIQRKLLDYLEVFSNIDKSIPDAKQTVYSVGNYIVGLVIILNRRCGEQLEAKVEKAWEEFFNVKPEKYNDSDVIQTQYYRNIDKAQNLQSLIDYLAELFNIYIVEYGLLK